MQRQAGSDLSAAVVPVSKVPKQAVVIIHGMGEQKPMETIRDFVRAVWQTDTRITRQDIPDAAAVFSKPDPRTGSLELRRITTRESKDTRTFPEGVRTDFYELYWADLSDGSTVRHVWAWIWTLLLRNPLKNVPSDVFLAWILLWVLTLVIVTFGLATVLPRNATVFGVALWRVIPPLAWLAPFQTWQLAVATSFIGFLTYPFVVPRFGRVVRYTRASPENIAARKNIRERGLALLEDLHCREYERIIIVAHSLGSILAYDLISHFWAGRPEAYTISVHDPEFALLRELQRTAMDLAAADLQNVEVKRKDYFSAQRDFCRALRQRAMPAKGVRDTRWLITDLVTVGSPLTHAEFLLARDAKDFTTRKLAREIPASPPVFDELDSATFSAAKEAQLPFDPEKPELLCFNIQGDMWRLHHAAPYAAVRWTNIHDPAFLVGMGDIISGPLEPLFGRGVIDIDLKKERGRQSYRFTHTRYWHLPDKTQTVPAHLIALRRALDLAGEHSSP